jgi:hypothetical protein
MFLKRKGITREIHRISANSGGRINREFIVRDRKIEFIHIIYTYQEQQFRLHLELYVAR